MVKAFDIIEPGLFRIAGKQTGTNQHIEHLRAFVVLPRDPVLHQVFTFELLYRRVTEGHITTVIDKRFHVVKLCFAVVVDQVLIVFFLFHQLDHMTVESRRFKLAKRLLTQVENRQTGGQVLVVWRLGRNQISSGLNQRFVNIGGLDAIVKLNMRL